MTIAEVLSKAGYATAFHGKWHLGDIEESYPHNQGFDEAFFTGYNQILSLNNKLAEGANATMGLFEDMLPPDPVKLDWTAAQILRINSDGRFEVVDLNVPLPREDAP